ncbi:uncharacterized protein TNCV_2004501 [Trichonephila clavipes]|nr:uncharacterized protein TNCV_2004501 [Trichonephila clavipes]
MWTAEGYEVVFTDESRICLQHHDGRIRVWRPRGEIMLNSCVMHRHIGPALGIMWTPSHVGVLGNEAADDLAGRECDLPNPSSTVLTHSEIHSFQRNQMNLNWRNPPAHHCYAAKSPGLSIKCRSSRAHQTVLAHFISGHLRSMTFVLGGGKVFLYLSLLSPCFSCSSSGLLGHFPATVI